MRCVRVAWDREVGVGVCVCGGGGGHVVVLAKKRTDNIITSEL